jgi:hypothetical protein
MNDPPILPGMQPTPPPPPGPAKWELFDPSPSAMRPRPIFRGELGLSGPALTLGLVGAALWLFEAFTLDGLEIRRRRRGRCPGCNYDRSGLEAGAACPECGAGAAATS